MPGALANWPTYWRVVETRLADNLPDVSDGAASLDRFVQQGRKVPDANSTAEGSATTLVAALDPAVENMSGAYLNDCSVYESTPFSTDSRNAEKLCGDERRADWGEI
ncbi:hypothetical protein DL95DRAFT_463204 [Leptodontidium sp. 2 PMI_412]|nr:hypothetical protein DL95DRAFT_463204 [Leptodontidium sp. 2 PMI_412]